MKTKDDIKTKEQIEMECLKEIAEVLKKHNCSLEVGFQKDVVLGTPVLKYQPMIIYKAKE